MLVALWIFFISCSVYGQGYNGSVSVEAIYQVYQKGKLFTAKSASLYKGNTGEIISHYLDPKNFYKTTNAKGEVTDIYTKRQYCYIPAKQSVFEFK